MKPRISTEFHHSRSQRIQKWFLHQKTLIDQVTVVAEVLVMLVRVVVGAWRPRIFGRGWVSGIIATILDR